MSETPSPTGQAVAVRDETRKLDLGAIISKPSRSGAMFLPSTMKECVDFATIMSKSDFAIPPPFRNNPGACLAVTIQAMRWEADPFAIIQKAYVTTAKGGDQRLSYEAQLFAAIVNTRAPIIGRLKLIYSGEGNGRKVKVIGRFSDTGEEREIETPPISKIHPKNSPLWVSDPDQQLAYYGMRSWSRRWVPELMLGIYSPEEFEAEPIDDAPRPQRPQVAQTDDKPTSEGIVEVAVEEEPVIATDDVERVVAQAESLASVQEEEVARPMAPITEEEAARLDQTRVDPGDGAARHGITGRGLDPAGDIPLDRDPSLDAFEKWDAFTNRSIESLTKADGDLKDERDFDDFSDLTKKAILEAAITSDEKDELRARFVTAFLNARRAKFGRKR